MSVKIGNIWPQFNARRSKVPDNELHTNEQLPKKHTSGRQNKQFSATTKLLQLRNLELLAACSHALDLHSGAVRSARRLVSFDRQRLSMRILPAVTTATLPISLPFPSEQSGVPKSIRLDIWAG